MRSLRRDLDALAVDTWRRIASGDARQLRLREDTISELNLLEIDIRHHRRLRVHRFNQNAERRSGADWEWFFGTGQRWFALRIQAKRMDGLEYRQLHHPGDGDDDYQYDTLIRTSKDAEPTTFPYHVFFNGWSSWPKGVPWHGCPNGRPRKWCEHVSDLEFGCSVVPASMVKTIHRGRGKPGRMVAEYLPFSAPWSWLFGPPQASSTLWHARHLRREAVRAATMMPPPDGPVETYLRWATAGLLTQTSEDWDSQFDAPVSTGNWGLLSEAVIEVDALLAWHQALTAELQINEAQPGGEQGLGGLVESYWPRVHEEYERRRRERRLDEDLLGPLPDYARTMVDLADDSPDHLRALSQFDSYFRDEPRTVLVTDLGQPNDAVGGDRDDARD